MSKNPFQFQINISIDMIWFTKSSGNIKTERQLTGVCFNGFWAIDPVCENEIKFIIVFCMCGFVWINVLTRTWMNAWLSHNRRRSGRHLLYSAVPWTCKWWLHRGRHIIQVQGNSANYDGKFKFNVKHCVFNVSFQLRKITKYDTDRAI